jgi:virginiamycin B lyase
LGECPARIGFSFPNTPNAFGWKELGLMKTLRLAITAVFGLLLASGCSGISSGPRTASPMAMPASISPASIAAAPMARTAILPASVMDVRPQTSVLGGAWTQIPGSASSVAAAADGSLWVLSTSPAGPDKYIWHYASGSWSNIAGLASRLAVAPNGTLFAINSGGGTYSYSGGTWSSRGGGASGVTTAADGSFYVLSNGGAGPDRAIWHNVSGIWSQVPGSGVSIVGSLDTGSYALPIGTIVPGGLYIVNSVGSMYYENIGGIFVQLPGNASALAPATAGVFALGYPANAGGSALYFYDLGVPGWSAQPGSGVSIASNGGKLYVIASSGAIYVSTVTTTPPSGPISVIPALSNVVRGTAGATATTAMLAAISTAGDQTTIGRAGTLATTSLSLGSGTSAQSVSQLSMLRAPILITAPPPVEAFPADDRALRAMMMRVPHMTVSGAPHYRPATSTIPTNPTVGSTANIWVAVFGLGAGSATYQQVPATLEAQTTHGNIWIDNSLISGSKSSPSFNAGNATVTAGTIASDFENAYTSDTTHFGTPHYSASAPGLQVVYQTCNASGVVSGVSAQYIHEPADQRINDTILNTANLGAGVGGYFSSINYLPQAIVNCFAPSTSPAPQYSNEAPMIYNGWFQSFGATYELGEDLVRGTSHEFQHLINFTNHSILASGASSISYNGAEDTFINEGLSMLAQDLAVNTKYPSVPFDSLDALQHAAAYLNTPQKFSVSGFIGVDSSPYGNGSTVAYNCGGGCYGSAYLFQRYMRDRFGGDTYTRGMETSGVSGFANVVANCGCAETGAALLQDFALAMSANTVGLTGQTARYTFGTLNLKGGRYPSPLAAYQAPNLTGLNALALSPNSSGTAAAPLGGFAFFGLTSPGGEKFSITDTNPTAAFGLLGGLAQH